ncbi:LpqB family beta-propeller domain-containing protein [Streptomyces sp. SP17BM10]|uniref:LpqB family beta-propeller domain-containing protein n=1 Tax=Streptomyces sp. SP17BM10 TaxID=3002530 RepID=UPI002E791680|nr:LpqB family beta-propeller domain-containing protein [Streptomyces sp. SP17BM10]MEE1786003.1 LpqB family beta-propeller domain-containing protein [Streptomyces sp. SP17BM10]
MRRTSGRPDPRLAAVAGGVLVALLAGGCAAMPDSGGITKVELSQGSADKNLQVRVFPVGPARGAKPQDLLAGFLDAVTADEGYDTARKYLTEEAAAAWNPDAGITVLAATPPPSAPDVPETEATTTLSITGQVVAAVDPGHTYALVTGQSTKSSDFTFQRQKDGEWRIDKLPPGLIMNETNFRNSYRQVDRYFYTAPDPSAAGFGPAPEVLVADPIYLRRRTDPLTAAAKALVGGPSNWLGPAVRTAFPSGASVDRVNVDDSRVAHVQLGGTDLADAVSCRRMATQLFYTLAEQGKGQVERAELKGRRGGCAAGRGDSPFTGPGALAGVGSEQQYLQRSDNGALVLLNDTTTSSVRGVLGKPQPAGRTPLGPVAVRRDGSQAAVLSRDHHQLYSVPLSDNAVALPDPVLTSAHTGDDGLASPSWDGRGDLWVVDRSPESPRVVTVRGNRTYTVPVEKLDGRSVQMLRVSSDGARIALVVKDANSSGRSLMFGAIVHGGTPEAPTVRIVGLHTAAPAITDVSSLSWAESDQLLVLGKEADRLPQLHYVSTDGSPSTDAPAQGGEGMATAEVSEAKANVLSAAEPVLALQATEGRIYRLINSQWREVTLPDRASAFFYPG